MPVPAGAPYADFARRLHSIMLAFIGPLVAANSPDVAEVGLGQSTATKTLVDASTTLACKLAAHVHAVSSAESVVAAGGHQRPRLNVQVAQLLDIEESIWAPKFGLKGVIDASLVLKVAEEPRGGSSTPFGHAGTLSTHCAPNHTWGALPPPLLLQMQNRLQTQLSLQCTHGADNVPVCNRLGEYIGQ